MAGLSDLPWRRLLRSLGGVGLIATEMVSARAFIYCDAAGNDLPARLNGVESEDRPLAVQIWDNTPETLRETAKNLIERYHVTVVDMNFGCPAPKIVKNSASGSWLLRDPQKVGELIRQVVQICAPVPVTAKIRLGLTFDTINAVEVAQAAEEAGAAALTVHGRTTSQLYRGYANWDEIAKVKTVLKKIPLIGNGDITSLEIALDRLENYPVDGIMIGRGALERPWLFRQIQQALSGQTVDAPPSPEEQRDILLRHFQYSLEHYGQEKGLILMRRFACFYSKGKYGGKAFRTAIGRISQKEDFLRLVDDLFRSR